MDTNPSIIDKLRLMKFHIKSGKDFVEEISLINIRRIKYIALTMGVVHFAHVLLFFLSDSGDTVNTIRWYYGIIIAHSIMFVIALSLVATSAFLLKRNLTNSNWARSMQMVVALIYLLFGASVCIVDQLVASNINAYLVACSAVAITISLRPVQVFINYVIAFVFIYNLVPLTQLNEELLLSVRVNSITATGIGIGLSLVLWHSNILNLSQQKIIMQQKDDLEEAHERIKQTAYYDPLTNLPNRRLFYELASKQLKLAQLDKRSLALLFIDLDGFKEVNDTLSHEAGDLILSQVANVLKETLSQADIISRMGGDEFVILITEIKEINQYASVVERLISAINKPTYIMKNQVSVGASIGISIFPSDGDDLEQLLRKSDDAMYVAKGMGGNSYQFWNNSGNENCNDKTKLTS